ncbi:hypothetical protein D9M68_832410 [compost metagenome]
MQWAGIGALRPGYKADLVIVDQNPLTCTLDALPKTQVLRTVLGGKDVFDTSILPRLDEAELPPERLQSLKRSTTLHSADHECGPHCNHPK